MDLGSYDRALGSLPRRLKSCEAVLDVSARLLAFPFQKPEEKDQALPKSTAEDLLTLIQFPQWEAKAAAYVTCGSALKEGWKLDTNFLKPLEDLLETDLEHTEPRLRTSVVSVIRELAARNGPNTWSRFGPILLGSVERNLVLDKSEREQTMKQLAESETGTQISGEKSALFHETVGWKALETSMRGLQNVILGYGPSFISDGHLTDRLMNIVTVGALTHENRYVREVGFDVCGVIVGCLCKCNQGKNNDAVAVFATAIENGLTDNWSQVRYAASIAVRTLMLGLQKEEREPYLERLVPRMCLNRYYLAQGVKLYSQETWLQVFGEDGIPVVARHSDAVIDFYCLQCRADNHAVREAACYCIAELATKVTSKGVAARVDELLKALIDAFKDESWPVRDAACIATAKFVSGFPEECRTRIDAELFTLWFDHLSDNIWSVREDSAVALGTVMRAYPNDAAILSKIKEKLAADLKEVYNQPETPVDTCKSKKIHVHDDKFNNQQLFSCGSLAPKLKRGVGCMDHGFIRPKQPWESTDGGIYLLRELAAVHPKEAEEYLEELAKIPNVKMFSGYYTLCETLWKQLVHIAKSVGKRPFKRHLEEFLPNLVKALEFDNQLCAHAAAACIEELEKLLGKGIFQGRVLDMFNGDRLWDTIEKHHAMIHFSVAS